MTKYLGVSMIVLGTIIMLVSYLSQSCDAIAGLFPISWVDINGVQIVAFFHLILGGVLAHILSIKLAGAEKERSGKSSEIGLALAAFALIVAIVPLCLGKMEDQPAFLPAVSIYGGMLAWLVGLACTMTGFFVGKKQLAQIGFGVLALGVVAALVTAATVYAEAA